MEFLTRPIFKTARIPRQTLLAITVVGLTIVMVGLGLLGVLVFNNWQSFSGLTPKLPAVISPAMEKPEEAAKSEEVALETTGIAETEQREYTETAQKGEGITHLARRALKGYLKENSQSFKVTPEHKVYIEDELAKKMSGKGLKLGEKLEFSDNLLKEAIQKSEQLTQKQLKNLTQFSQIVPSLNY